MATRRPVTLHSFLFLCLMSSEKQNSSSCRLSINAFILKASLEFSVALRSAMAAVRAMRRCGGTAFLWVNASGARDILYRRLRRSTDRTPTRLHCLPSPHDLPGNPSNHPLPWFSRSLPPLLGSSSFTTSYFTETTETCLLAPKKFFYYSVPSRRGPS